MPVAAAPLVGAGISALGGLFGGSKPKQEQTSTQNSTANFNQSQSQEASSDQRRTFDENPLFGGGREAIMRMLMNEFGKAQQPVYGNAQVSKFMADLNELTSAATGKLKNTLAGSGGLNNGRFAGGVAGLEANRLKEMSNFISQLPMINEQQRQKSTNSLLGLGAQWLGLGPVNETITGSTKANSTTTGTENRTSTGNSTSTGNDGRGGWNGLLGGLADFGGGLLGDVIGGRGDRWGFKPRGMTDDYGN